MRSSSVDSKLVYLVRKFLSFSVDESPNPDHIVHCLRTQHREYQRKDLSRLKRQVQKVLKRLTRSSHHHQQQQSTSATTIEEIAKDASNGTGNGGYNGASNGNGYHKSSSGNGGGGGGGQNGAESHVDSNGRDFNATSAPPVIPSSSSSKKRSLEQQQGDDQPQEKRSRKRESSSQRSARLIGNNVLNAALLERYRQLQQEREDEAAAVARDAAAAAAASGSGHGDGGQTATTIPMGEGWGPAADSLLSLHNLNSGSSKTEKREGASKSKTGRSSSSRRELTTSKKRSSSEKYAVGELEKDSSRKSSKSLKRKKSSSSRHRSSSSRTEGAVIPIEGSGIPSSSSSSKHRRHQHHREDRDPNTSAVVAAAALAPILTVKPRSSSSSSKKVSRKKHSSSSNINNLSMTKYDRSSNAAIMPGLDLTSTFAPMPANRPTERYSDLGGLSHVFKQIVPFVEYPLLRPELYVHLGIDPPRGVLLRGPPGCGKTHLANAIAGQLMGMTITSTGSSSPSSSRGSTISFFRASGPELVSGISGESEGRIRELFRAASNAAPSIVFLDELDVLAPNRRSDSSKGSMEKRMVAQLLSSMDSLDPKNNRNNAPVIVLGATNQLRADSIDPALRRAGRFDKELLLGVPDEDGRVEILKAIAKSSTLKLKGDLDFKVLARKTPGYVGADLRSLIKEAAAVAIHRILTSVQVKEQNHSEDRNGGSNGTTMNNNSNNNKAQENGKHQLQMTEYSGSSDTKNYHNGQFIKDGKESSNTNHSSMAGTNDSAVIPLTEKQMEPLRVTMKDFLAAIPMVQPSSKREGFATVPDVTWDAIGALTSIREQLSLSVLEPIRRPERFKALGIPLPAGVMLYGPPGCGKTLLAKAIANESGANFISVKGPELLDKYVGESERAVRSVFERARSSSPCIVFFDELDSLCPKRGKGDGGGNGVSERVVNQLLTEMDGLESRRSVFVIAATNRPELIDPAMMRPGRLDKLLYVPLPTPEDRVAILKALSVGIQLHPSVDLHAIGTSKRAEGYSGADCAALLREAGLAVLKEDFQTRYLSSSGTGSEDGETGQKQSDSFAYSALQITEDHFEYAFDHVIPSVSRKDQARYDRMRDRMAHARSRGSVTQEEGQDDDQTENDGILLSSLPIGGSSSEGKAGAETEQKDHVQQEKSAEEKASCMAAATALAFAANSVKNSSASNEGSKFQSNEDDGNTKLISV